MRITVNGQPQLIEGDPASLLDTLGRLGFVVERVAVELNGAIVRRRAYAETLLRDGDVLEVVTLVGGG